MGKAVRLSLIRRWVGVGLLCIVVGCSISALPLPPEKDELKKQRQVGVLDTRFVLMQAFDITK